MRGRNNNNNNNSNNNNNRKGPNPLTRSYESNGPDVKIRGSAQQIAEKYTTLARDATSSGDRVMAENYLQHAEHYNRIIAAAQAQMPIQNFQGSREDADEDMDDERDEFDTLAPSQPHQQGGHPQQGQQRQYNEHRQANNGGGGNNGSNGGYNHGGARSHGGAGSNGSDNNGNGEGYQPAVARNSVDHAQAPQPVIEGMPAEIAFNPDAGFGSAPQPTQENNRRRERRGRFNERNGERDGLRETASPREDMASDEGSGVPATVTTEVEAVADAVEARSESGPEGDGPARRGRRPRRGSRSRGEGDPAAEVGAAPAPEFDPGIPPAGEAAEG